jgi:serine phosphatase RsbU (regulator of sigma subunit)
LNISTLYRAAPAAEEIEVGGDFYDFYESDGGWIVLLGDVTGKGIEAAALTSLVRHGARFLSKYERSPSQILVRLNEALSEQPGLWLCTAVCVRLEDEQAVIASAGHPAPLVVRDDGRVREIGTVGPILGAWTGDRPVERSVSIAADETLFLYTDGVLDTLGDHERFGVERLKRLLAERAGDAPDVLLSDLEAGLDRFQVGAQPDDTAALALRPAPVLAGVEPEAAQRAAHRADPSRTLRVT